jgi:general secretion pathway protein G
MTLPDRRKPSDEEGFSFLEIMIVVIIIGLLTTLVATNIFGRFGKAQHTLSDSKLNKVANALELFKVDNGFYPNEQQGLEALVREPSGEPQPRSYPPGGYLKKADLTDAWGRTFEYRAPGQHNSHSFDLFSFGEDGVEGGEDNAADITNWDSGA